MESYLEAAKLIASLVALGQQFTFADNPQFISPEYLASVMTSAGGDLFAATISCILIFGEKGETAAAPSAQVGTQTETVSWRTSSLDSSASSSLGIADYGDGTIGYVDNDGKFVIRPDSETGSISEKAAPEETFTDWTDLILRTLGMAEFLELTTGFGPPDEGGDLQDGAEQFSTFSEQLDAAFPDENWQASASLAYCDRNVEQQDRAQQLADLDRQLAALVKEQADWVTHMRLGFGILKDLLALAVVIRLRMITDPLTTEAASIKFAITVSALGAAIAVGMVVGLAGVSGNTGQKMDALTRQYKKLAENTALADEPEERSETAMDGAVT